MVSSAAAGAAGSSFVASEVAAGASAGVDSAGASASEEVQRVCEMYQLPEHKMMLGSTNQVITEKLHDERRILVALLREGVELCHEH